MPLGNVYMFCANHFMCKNCHLTVKLTKFVSLDTPSEDGTKEGSRKDPPQQIFQNCSLEPFVHIGVMTEMIHAHALVHVF